jgi:hypothetical protein
MTLDVTDLFSDPDFATCFDVVRRTETVSKVTGRPSVTEELFEGVVGSVISKGLMMNRRDPDSSMTYRAIQVSSTFRFRMTSEGAQPDIIVYDGVRYTLTELKDHTRWGGGWMKVLALNMEANQPPTEGARNGD